MITVRKGPLPAPCADCGVVIECSKRASSSSNTVAQRTQETSSRTNSSPRATRSTVLGPRWGGSEELDRATEAARHLPGDTHDHADSLDRRAAGEGAALHIVRSGRLDAPPRGPDSVGAG